MKRENTLYYHTDHLGSSGYVTDKKGEFYEHTEYTSSGESWVNEKVTGNADLPFKYTGHRFDSETNLYYCGARYYDARTSRFISPDDRIDGFFSTQGWNMYSYVQNNPINMVDPDGHEKRQPGLSQIQGWILKNNKVEKKTLEARPLHSRAQNTEAKAQKAISDQLLRKRAERENAAIAQARASVAGRRDNFELTEGTTQTSDYGWRGHPVRGGLNNHEGLDFVSKDGWVQAQMDGTVSKVGEYGGYGQSVIVDSGPIDGTPDSPRMTQLYGHFDEYMAPNGKMLPLIFVKPGDKVQRGDIIGYQGMTGTATGPHCHFEIRIGGVAVDPFVMPRADTMSTWGP